MDRRFRLQSRLERVLGPEPEQKVQVYFQAPNDGQMVYPCIVYEAGQADSRHAGNSLYQFFKRYTVTVITDDPDSPIPDAVATLPWCSHSTFFVANNQNHHVFDIFI